MKVKTSAQKYFVCVRIPSHQNKNLITITCLCTAFGPLGLRGKRSGVAGGGGRCGKTLPPLIKSPAHAYDTNTSLFNDISGATLNFSIIACPYPSGWAIQYPLETYDMVAYHGCLLLPTETKAARQFEAHAKPIGIITSDMCNFFSFFSIKLSKPGTQSSRQRQTRFG